MSSSIGSTGIDYLSLFPSTDSSASSTTDLLSTLYGNGTSASGAGGGDPIAALRLAQANQTQDIAATAKQPSVARDIAAFKTAVANAKSPADLLNNPTALKVLLTTNGLSAQIGFPALAQKVLLSNVNTTNSLVNRLANSNWTAATKTYDFANSGLANIQKSGVVDTIANAYAEVSWRQSLDAATPGLSNALTFKAEAATVTSVDQILGDPVLRDVVTTALGIPQQIAFQSIQAQEKAISTRLDITQLKQPQFVNTLTDQYLFNKASSSTASNTPSLDQLAIQSQGLVV